jgi:hypothetical protein
MEKHTQLHYIGSLFFENENPVVSTSAITKVVVRRRISFKKMAVRTRKAIWNLLPLHWFDGFKEIEIDMSEFACKKSTPKEQ